MKKEVLNRIERLNEYISDLGYKVTIGKQNGYICLFQYVGESCIKMLESFKTYKEVYKYLNAFFVMHEFINNPKTN